MRGEARRSGNSLIIALQHEWGKCTERAGTPVPVASAAVALPVVAMRLRIGSHVDGAPMTATTQPGVRHARRPVHTVVWISRADHAWSSEIIDISATGARALRPTEWEGDIDDVFQLDVVISETAALHMEARVVRLTAVHVAFEFTLIPESGQQLFWGLLGRYAEQSEPID